MNINIFHLKYIFNFSNKFFWSNDRLILQERRYFRAYSESSNMSAMNIARLLNLEKYFYYKIMNSKDNRFILDTISYYIIVIFIIFLL